MKNALRLAAFAIAAAPMGAMAHVGSHDQVEGGLLHHLLTEVSHLTAFAAIAAPILLYAGVRGARRLIARLRG